MKFLNPIVNPNWLAITHGIYYNTVLFNNFRNGLKLDFSAGCSVISSDYIDRNETDLSIMSDLNVPNQLEDVIIPASPILWAHQMGRGVTQKIPDNALLGVLVLVATELLQRALTYNKDMLPITVRDFAQNVLDELDSKLEMLSSLNWNTDPFFKAELENLQSQPLEVIDKFLVTQILPGVDKDFAPFLLKYMVADSVTVQKVTRNVKDLIELCVELLRLQRVAEIRRTTSTIKDSVDLFGQNVEDLINDWNDRVTKFSTQLSEVANNSTSVKAILTDILLKASNANSQKLQNKY